MAERPTADTRGRSDPAAEDGVLQVVEHEFSVQSDPQPQSLERKDRLSEPLRHASVAD